MTSVTSTSCQIDHILIAFASMMSNEVTSNNHPIPIPPNGHESDGAEASSGLQVLSSSGTTITELSYSIADSGSHHELDPLHDSLVFEVCPPLLCFWNRKQNKKQRYKAGEWSYPRIFLIRAPSVLIQFRPIYCRERMEIMGTQRLL